MIIVPSMFGIFLSWWGLFVLAVCDSTMVLFLPFGIDGLVIYLAARGDELFWMAPLLATGGSVTGAAITFWVGEKIGEIGLERLVPTRRLERLRDRVRDNGAIALAVPALLPPPFPLTPFVLTCGALAVDRRRFFLTFSIARLLRFGTEALLARTYGRGVLLVLESAIFRWIVGGFIVLAVAGTAVSAVLLWRSTRVKRLPSV